MGAVITGLRQRVATEAALWVGATFVTAEPALPVVLEDLARSTFTAFVSSHGPTVERAARRVVGPDAAEDVAQDALLRLWRMWPALGHDTERSKAVVLVTARRLALNLRASHAVSRTEPRCEWDDAAAGLAPSAADPVLDAEWWDRCRAVVDTLTPDQLTVILLDGDGSAVALARRCGVDAATMRQRRHRAVTRLRERARRAGLTAPSLVALLRAPRRTGRRVGPATVHGSITIAGFLAVTVLFAPVPGAPTAPEVELPQPEAFRERPADVQSALAGWTRGGASAAAATAPPPARQQPDPDGGERPSRRRVPVEPPEVAVCLLPTQCLGSAQRADELCLHPTQDFGPTCAKQAAVPMCDALPRTPHASCTRDPRRPPSAPSPPRKSVTMVRSVSSPA